jgi:hypothetical protein
LLWLASSFVTHVMHLWTQTDGVQGNRGGFLSSVSREKHGPFQFETVPWGCHVSLNQSTKINEWNNLLTRMAFLWLSFSTWKIMDVVTQCAFVFHNRSWQLMQPIDRKTQPESQNGSGSHAFADGLPWGMSSKLQLFPKYLDKNVHNLEESFAVWNFQGLGKLAMKFPGIAPTSINCLTNFLVLPSPVLSRLHKQSRNSQGIGIPLPRSKAALRTAGTGDCLLTLKSFFQTKSCAVQFVSLVLQFCCIQFRSIWVVGRRHVIPRLRLCGIGVRTFERLGHREPLLGPQGWPSGKSRPSSSFRCVSCQPFVHCRDVR